VYRARKYQPVCTADVIIIDLQASDWVLVLNSRKVDEKASSDRGFGQESNDRKFRDVAKPDFSKPSVERLSERFLKKKGFSEKPGITKSISVEAAQMTSARDFRLDIPQYLLQK
jgi:hypothetical protein